jgi:hypothetical protein
MRAIEFSLLCWADHAPTFCYPSSYPQEELFSSSLRCSRRRFLSFLGDSYPLIAIFVDLFQLSR